MGLLRFSICLAYFLLILPLLYVYTAEENFILINGITNEVMIEQGPHINEKVTPCSTFKIILSLMGYDSGILKDEKIPIWDFQEGYDDYLESWKASQTAQSWMKNSCIWYSKVIASKLGLERMQHYLQLLEYGNQDLSGGLTQAWVNSSLKISPKEQVNVLRNMIQGNLSISNHSVQMTKMLLFIEELPNGWKLFGKTGWSGSKPVGKNFQTGWFIGWVEKEDKFFPFAYNIHEAKINLPQRIPRVMQLLKDSNVMTIGAGSA